MCVVFRGALPDLLTNGLFFYVHGHVMARAAAKASGVPALD